MIETAPAKVNLALHVTGRRADGYHLLDSLVVFPRICDTLRFTPADRMSLTIDGPQDLDPGEDNLVLRAAHAFLGQPHHIHLIKTLPIAAGIGGGSADAAAVIRVAQRLDPGRMTPQDLADRSVALGADVPVCLDPVPQRMRGIGDEITPLLSWPNPVHMLLANPGIPVSTAAIFKTLASRDNPSLPKDLPSFKRFNDLTGFLQHSRNDLEPPAIALAPVIGDVIAQIAGQTGCALARMSGSGATCFGLFEAKDDAMRAVEALSAVQPKWWVACGEVRGPSPQS